MKLPPQRTAQAIAEALGLGEEIASNRLLRRQEAAGVVHQRGNPRHRQGIFAGDRWRPRAAEIIGGRAIRKRRLGSKRQRFPRTIAFDLMDRRLEQFHLRADAGPITLFELRIKIPAQLPAREFIDHLAQLGAVLADDGNHLRDERIVIGIDIRDRRRNRNVIHKRPIGLTPPLPQFAWRYRCLSFKS